MKLFKRLTVLTAALTLAFSLAACGGETDPDNDNGDTTPDNDNGDTTKDPVQLAAGDWDSIQIHNEVAMFIMEHGYDQAAEQQIADTPVQIESLRNGSFHLNLEMWKANMATYDPDIAEGYYHEVSVNFIDPGQGIYIPEYLQESHQIYTLQDLNDHVELFYHPEVADGKGIIYGGPLGWAATDFLNTKFNNSEDYPNLVNNFEFYEQGSTAVLNVSLQNAYDNQEPWVGYHWAPTWPHAVMDLVLLEDEIEYDADAHETRALGNLPAGDVTVVVTDGFDDEYPEIFEFISNYATSTEITSEMIFYKQENEIENDEVAIWFLNNYQDVWSQWVPEDVVTKVNAALDNE